MGQTLVFGFIAGGIYALIAAGIVLVYKGSRVLNFAQAEVGTLSLYATWWISGEHSLPWFVGALAAIGVAMTIGLAFEWLAVRRMVEATRVAVAVATIGLFSLTLALENVLFGATPRHIPPPIEGLGLEVAGVLISPAQLLAAGVVAIIAIGLSAFFKYTDFGLGVLASAQDPVAARLAGISQKRVSAFIWGTAGALSAIACLLIQPTVQVLAPGVLGGLFLGGLTAALVGGLNSLPGAFVGGLVVGTIEALVKAYLITLPIPGVNIVGLFAMIALVLLFRPQGLVGARA
jgi:branched-chain amino acid transport system permease protein